MASSAQAHTFTADRVVTATGTKCRPVLTEACMAMADLIGLALAEALGFLLLRFLIASTAPMAPPWLLLLVFWPLFLLFDLYPAALQTPDLEIQRLTKAVAIGTAFMAALFLRAPFQIGWLVGIPIMGLSRIILIYGLRDLARSSLGKQPWFGHPVLLVGSSWAINQVGKNLQRWPQHALKPAVVCVVDAFSSQPDLGIGILHSPEEARDLACEAGVQRAIVAIDDPMRAEYLARVVSATAHFSHVSVITDTDLFSECNRPFPEISRAAVIVWRNRLRRRLDLIAKRSLDIAFALTLAPVVLPAACLIAALIVLESRGPVLYGHPRIGRHNRSFKTWKFRSMVTDGDRVLKQFLASNSEAQAEWNTAQKLRRDPRVTRIGRLLRTTSLDELPQLWNILTGQMSLVGPRPIVQSEAVFYGPAFKLYTQVTPGLTGLWQISGRNNTSYEERVQFDTHYVKNWSFWLDLHILTRTLRVVLFREGAY